MKTKHLKLASIVLLFLFSILQVSSLYAGTISDSVTVKVIIAPSISVSITESTLALGSVNAGATKVSTSVTVTNDGSGINETFSISLTNPSGWTASQTAAGSETYILNTAFDADGSGITWAEANHALSTTATASSATKFAADQTGVSVPYNATRKLWFQFKAPTATTVSAEQSITVTVTAAAA